MIYWLRLIFSLPIEVLRSASQVFEFAFQSICDAVFYEPNESDDPDTPKRSVWITLLMLPVLLPLWCVRTALSRLSFHFSWTSIHPERRVRLLLGIPSMICMALLIAGFVYTWTQRDSIKNRYQSRMETAIAAKDFNLATVLAERVIQESPEKDPRMRMRYAMILGESGNHDKAMSIINDLAPDNAIGFSGAHRFKAGQIAEKLRQGTNENNLKAFRWHLDNSGSEVREEVEVMRAFYHSLIGQNDNVVHHLETASKMNPSHLLTLSDVYLKMGNTVASERALIDAEESFEKRLKDAPLEKSTRVKLCLTKSKLGKLDQAEEIMMTGVKLNSDQDICRAAADFSLMRFDRLRSDNKPIDQQFAYLQKAIALDPNYMAIYDRLTEVYSVSTNKSGFEELKTILADLIVEGRATAMAHFALGSLLWTDGKIEDSNWHLRQSFKIDPKMPLVCNNMAWMIAHSESGQLDEAMDLVKQALLVQPDRAEFRDTLGVILMKQEKYDEAIAEFEAILSNPALKKSIHRNLAICYQKIGKSSLAKAHAEKAE